MKPICSKRNINEISHDYSKFKPAEENTYAQNESDSNADTCCLGKNFAIMSYTSRTADVYPYDSSYAPIQNVPIVSGATAYDHPSTGQTWLLIINEGLFYGNKLDHTLINPNQIRHYQIEYWDNPYDKEHDLEIHIPGILSIPMFQLGTKLQFQTRSPTAYELNNISSEFRIQLTSAKEWNPETVLLSSLNTNKNDTPFHRINENGDSIYADPTSDEALLHSISPHIVKLQVMCIINYTIVSL